jgi:molybdenum cofactor cytidylyltransferase
MRRVAAVILAAGGSSRLGQAKQLLKFRGETLVRRAVRAAAEAGCEPTVVIVGESAPAIRPELRESAALMLENREWRRGLGTSIRRGTEFVLQCVPDVDALLLLVCDQPLLEAGTIVALVAEQEKSGKLIIASSYAGTFGVPALFDRSRFAALLALPDDSGAKSLIEARPQEVGSVSFEAGAIDIDTPEDFERLNANSD